MDDLDDWVLCDDFGEDLRIVVPRTRAAVTTYQRTYNQNTSGSRVIDLDLDEPPSPTNHSSTENTQTHTHSHGRESDSARACVSAHTNTSVGEVEQDCDEEEESVYSDEMRSSQEFGADEDYWFADEQTHPSTTVSDEPLFGLSSALKLRALNSAGTTVHSPVGVLESADKMTGTYLAPAGVRTISEFVSLCANDEEKHLFFSVVIPYFEKLFEEAKLVVELAERGVTTKSLCVWDWRQSFNPNVVKSEAQLSPHASVDCVKGLTAESVHQLRERKIISLSHLASLPVSPLTAEWLGNEDAVFLHALIDTLSLFIERARLLIAHCGDESAAVLHPRVERNAAAQETDDISVSIAVPQRVVDLLAEGCGLPCAQSAFEEFMKGNTEHGPGAFWRPLFYDRWCERSKFWSLLGDTSGSSSETPTDVEVYTYLSWRMASGEIGQASHLAGVRMFSFNWFEPVVSKNCEVVVRIQLSQLLRSSRESMRLFKRTHVGESTERRLRWVEISLNDTTRLTLANDVERLSVNGALVAAHSRAPYIVPREFIKLPSK